MNAEPAQKSQIILNRNVLGVLVGTAAWFFFAFFLNKPGDFSPAISVILIMIITNSYEPRRIAGLAAASGWFAGVSWSIQAASQNAGETGLFWLVGICLFAAGFMAYFAFLGILFSNLVLLYKRGAIL